MTRLTICIVINIRARLFLVYLYGCATRSLHDEAGYLTGRQSIECLVCPSSQVKSLSLLPSLQCLDNNPCKIGGLVIK